MKFTSRALAAIAASTVGAFATKDTALSQEDEQFWGRFLEGSSSISPSPTPEPQETCFVNVGITCTASDGSDCAGIVPPTAPNDEDCTENVCYTIEIENIGGVCMDITLADLNLNGDIADVLELIPTNPLCPTEKTSFEACGDIDICSGGTYSATIKVEADPPNGSMCADDGNYTFTVPPLAPVAPPVPPPVSPPVPPPVSPPVAPPSPGPTPAGPCLVEVEIAFVVWCARFRRDHPWQSPGGSPGLCAF